MSDPISGGCLCGKVRYTVSQSPTRLITCHCTNCQKASGAGATHNAVVATDAVTFISGKPKAYADTAASGNTLNRYFCGDCGSPIYSKPANLPKYMILKVGTLDTPGDMKITMNLWTKSARPWMHIDPSIECHAENRPAKA